MVESLNSDPSLTPCPEPALSVLRIAFDLEFGGVERLGHFEIAVPRSFFEAAAPAGESAELTGESAFATG